MPETKVKINLGNETKEGVDVPIDETIERWSEIKLSDGTILRVKQAVLQVIKLNEYDKDDGNPSYLIKSSPQVAIGYVPENLKRR